jgi:hypothetical protein
MQLAASNLRRNSRRNFVDWEQQERDRFYQMNRLWQIHRHMGFLLLGLMSSPDDDSDSLASESSLLSDEASSLSSFYSSVESSSGGGGGRRQAYRQGYRDAQGYDYNDYRRIPRGRGRRF